MRSVGHCRSIVTPMPYGNTVLSFCRCSTVLAQYKDSSTQVGMTYQEHVARDGAWPDPHNVDSGKYKRWSDEQGNAGCTPFLTH